MEQGNDTSRSGSGYRLGESDAATGPNAPSVIRPVIATSAGPAHSIPFRMPAPPEQAARDIARIGVEGRPADAKAGPRRLGMEVIVMLVVLMVLSAVVGVWAGWGIGLAMMIVGVLALMFNPVVSAVAIRATERQQAAKDEQEMLPPNSGRGR